jgi:hypothetical protein
VAVALARFGQDRNRGDASGFVSNEYGLRYSRLRDSGG